MNSWNDLTERHKRYAILAGLCGTAIGAVTGILIALLVGIALTSAGSGIMIIKKDEFEGRKAYTVWMSIAIGAVVCGLSCFIGAIIGLLMHQAGTI